MTQSCVDIIPHPIFIAPFTLEENPAFSQIDAALFWQWERVVTAFHPWTNDLATYLGNLQLDSKEERSPLPFLMLLMYLRVVF